MKVTSKVTINRKAIKQISTKAQTALGETADALHTEIQQAQVVPRDTGNLQNEAMFVDKSELKYGRVSIVHSTPYARRLYFHPEYNFHRKDWKEQVPNGVTKKGKKKYKTIKHGSNPNAKGHWFEDWEDGGENEDFCEDTFKKILKRLM